VSGNSRRLVGVCSQQIVLWGTLTCLEQLEFIGQAYGIERREARRRGEELLEIIGLSEKKNALARSLSGGMQRRLHLIMALVHDPEVLILDEPEAGLDPQSRILVRETIRSLARRKTVILTTHNMDEADRLADRVAVIDQGRRLALDTPEALKRTLGEGDILEIELAGVAPEVAAAPLGSLIKEIRVNGCLLTLRGGGIVEKLPAIIETIRSVGGAVGEIRLRANTLEDVFIALTGRKLRE
jgi:ABC-2 type transport system ATP-binding protein